MNLKKKKIILPVNQSGIILNFEKNSVFNKQVYWNFTHSIDEYKTNIEKNIDLINEFNKSQNIIKINIIGLTYNNLVDSDDQHKNDHIFSLDDKNTIEINENIILNGIIIFYKIKDAVYWNNNEYYIIPIVKKKIKLNDVDNIMKSLKIDNYILKKMYDDSNEKKNVNVSDNRIYRMNSFYFNEFYFNLFCINNYKLFITKKQIFNILLEIISTVHNIKIKLFLIKYFLINLHYKIVSINFKKFYIDKYNLNIDEFHKKIIIEIEKINFNTTIILDVEEFEKIFLSFINKKYELEYFENIEFKIEKYLLINFINKLTNKIIINFNFDKKDDDIQKKIFLNFLIAEFHNEINEIEKKNAKKMKYHWKKAHFITYLWKKYLMTKKLLNMNMIIW